ncbi:hypothetical protein AOLI_G00326760 [Acnodon oligacanthus]
MIRYLNSRLYNCSVDETSRFYPKVSRSGARLSALRLSNFADCSRTRVRHRKGSRSFPNAPRVFGWQSNYWKRHRGLIDDPINCFSADEPLVELQQKVSPSLRQALEKFRLQSETNQSIEKEERNEVKIGTPWPVFHEGMKYWSCCRRKTSDFNSFLSQEGCSKGTHVWKNTEGKKVVPCWFDWHQTGAQVTVSIYAKNSNPEQCSVRANSTTVCISVIFEGEKEFEQKISLWGVIDVSKSIVNMMASKIEIVLKKAEPMSWARLDLPPPQPPSTHEKKEKQDGEKESV